MEELLPKAGLVISAFFAISPLPMLITALTKDKSALNALSIPGLIMGLSCSTSILVFCQMKGLDDCVTGCYMSEASGLISFLVYCLLNKAFLQLFAVLIVEATLAYSVQNVFTDPQTNTVNLVLNTLACILMPLDQLDKLLKTKDTNNCSYLMNFLLALNCLICGLYNHNMGTVLSYPNFAGLACEIVLIPGILYANGLLGAGNPLVQLSKLWVFVFFKLPKMITGMKDEEPKTDRKSVDQSQFKQSNLKSTATPDFTPTPGESKKKR